MQNILKKDQVTFRTSILAKWKNVIISILVLPLVIYLIYCCHHAVTYDLNPYTLDCGIVVSKSTDEIIIKRGKKTELYLNVQFKKNGFQSVNSAPTTYFGSKVGEYVCFDMPQKQPKQYYLHHIIGVCCICTCMIFGLYGILLLFK